MESTPPAYLPSPLGYYPMDTPIYNEMKKAIYSLGQSLGNVCFNSQSAFDYFSLYKNQLTNQLELDDKMDKFTKAQQFLENQYAKYQQILNMFKNELASIMPSLSDNVPIDNALLLWFRRFRNT